MMSRLYFAVAFSLVSSSLCYQSQDIIEACLPSPVPIKERKNITIDGVDMPLGIWQLDWPVSELFTHMFKILAEEVLGYHVVTRVGLNSQSAIYALAGCHDGKECDPQLATPSSHISFDLWDGAWLEVVSRLARENPKGAPVHIGSMGYTGNDGFFLDKGIVQDGLAATGLGLDIFRSYNADFFSVTRFFSDHQVIDTADLTPCTIAELSNTVMGWVYRNHFPEDVDGYERYNATDGEERTRLHCPGEGYWWYSAACRGNVSKCVPFLATKEAWFAEMMMQRAAYYNMPIALGFAKSWDRLVHLVNLHNLLHYWWIPDVAFDLNQKSLLYFPDTNKTQWAQRLYVTSGETAEVTKYASRDLDKVAGQIFTTATRIQLPLDTFLPLLKAMAQEDKHTRDVACSFLLESGIWKHWVPEPTACEVGMGLADQHGDFVSNRSAASTCRACTTGRYSVDYSDAQGRSFECQLCPRGRFSAAFRADFCEVCPIGTAQLLEGRSACSTCETGEYVSTPTEYSCLPRMKCSPSINNISRCVPCQSGSYSSSPGSLRCDKCQFGRFAGHPRMSSCIACPIGTFAPSTGQSNCTSCDAYVRGSSSARASQSVDDCFCPKNTYKSHIGNVCEECGALKTTKESGATSQSECYFAVQFYVIICVPILCLAMLGVAFAIFRSFRKIRREVKESRLFDKIQECIRVTRELGFPIVLMDAKSFRFLGQLMPYEAALNEHLLLVLSTLEEVEKFKRDNDIVFFSHQWLAWGEPDAERVHYNAMVQAMNAIVQKMSWEESRCYIWVDYHSVPQRSKQLQLLAIKSLPFFASCASLFVMITPEAQHADTFSPCNFETYQRRMWCRAEIFSYYCRRGVNGMYRWATCTEGNPSAFGLNGFNLVQVETDLIDDVILVFEGDCTCCARNHEGMDGCDKEMLRDVFIGLYADVLWTHRSYGQASLDLDAGRVREIVSRFTARRERVFPKYFEATFMSESNSKIKHDTTLNPLGRRWSYTFSSRTKTVRSPLFGELVDYLEKLIQERPEIVKHLFLDNP